MSTIGWSALVAAAVVLVLPLKATAQQPRQETAHVPCGTRDQIVKVLKDNYGERAMAHGIAQSGSLAEVFISPRGTWTIIATSPNGISCMIGSGESWKTTLAADEST